MNCLDTAKRTQVIKCLIEGCSIRATCRMTGAAKNTVVKLLEDIGCVCAEYHHRNVRNIKVRRLQCDEIWCFVGSKAKNTPYEKRDEQGWGDIWTWVGIDADTKLVVSYLVGGRDAGWALEFMKDCRNRIKGNVQLSTDGNRAYFTAVETAFGGDVDYAMLHKIYGAPDTNEKRYSPGKCIGCDMKVISGAPDPKHVRTSYVERQNLTMRMSMRRFTRLTNGFSKKADNHRHSVALHYMFYNYCRPHQTLRITPAMAAGLTGSIWAIEDLIALIPKPSAKPTTIDRDLLRKALGESA